jgi:hypothetical protein
MLGLGLSITRSSYISLNLDVIIDYIARVEAAGGVVEASECLAIMLLDLGYNDAVYIISKEYVARVIAAGGIIEGLSCLENSLVEIM